jgi:hypothetical protein
MLKKENPYVEEKQIAHGDLVRSKCVVWIGSGTDCHASAIAVTVCSADAVAHGSAKMGNVWRSTVPL